MGQDGAKIIFKSKFFVLMIMCWENIWANGYHCDANSFFLDKLI